MGHKHTREQILEGALDVAFADGLSRLTFGRVASRLGTSDRMVVYYFPTKADLVTAVLVAVGLRLTEVIGRAFTSPADDHVELARAAWPVLATEESDPSFRLYFEAMGLAAAGQAPYRELAPQLVDAWIAWLASCLTGTDDERRTEAEATLVLIDGLLLVRQLSGPEMAERAAVRLGVSSPA